MSKIFTILFLLVTTVIYVAVNLFWRSRTNDVIIVNQYNYDGKFGPKHWPKFFKSCGGQHQSPVKLNSATSTKIKLPALNFKNFNQKIKRLIIINTGHTAMLSIPNQENNLLLSGGPLKGQYKFEQLHFHWGNRDDKGSEHLINNRAYSMEVHMVFWNKKYTTFDTAASNPDGIAVLAVFVQVSKLDSPAFDFVYLLKKVTQINASIDYTKPQKLQDLLPQHLSSYYTLEGSLTTPSCSEAVTWIIFKETIQISRAQLQYFRQLRDETGAKITHNFRPTQPLNDRIVYYNTA